MKLELQGWGGRECWETSHHLAALLGDGAVASQGTVPTCLSVFLQWYTPDACLQLKEHFHGQVSSTCQSRNTGTVG